MKGIATGVVYVNQARASQRTIPKDIAECIDGRLDMFLVHDPWQWCVKGRTDFYVIRTNLTATVERRAANVVGDVTVLVLPEAGDFLSQQVWFRAVEQGRNVWIYQGTTDLTWLNRTPT